MGFDLSSTVGGGPVPALPSDRPYGIAKGRRPLRNKAGREPRAAWRCLTKAGPRETAGPSHGRRPALARPKGNPTAAGRKPSQVKTAGRNSRTSSRFATSTTFSGLSAWLTRSCRAGPALAKPQGHPPTETTRSDGPTCRSAVYRFFGLLGRAVGGPTGSHIIICSRLVSAYPRVLAGHLAPIERADRHGRSLVSRGRSPRDLAGWPDHRHIQHRSQHEGRVPIGTEPASIRRET